MTIKHEIEIERLPEGWRAVAYRKALWGEWYLTERGIVRRCECTGMQYPALIVEQIKHHRIVLEETEEDNHEFHDLCGGSRYANQYIDDICLSNKKKIWRIVEEE